MSRRIIAIATLAAVCLAAALSAQFASATLRAHTTTQGSSTNPDGTSGPPQNTVAPTLNTAKAVKAGTTLTCNPGLWSDDPTSFRYRWSRNGALISGADSATYRTAQADARTKVGCQVNGHNDQGYGTTADTATVTVTAVCPAAGSLGSSSIGPLALGSTLAALKKRDATVTPKAGFEDFCIGGAPITRVGFPSARLLKSLKPAARRADRGRAVLIISAAPAYRLSGLVTGASLSTALRRGWTGPLVIGQNRWYVRPHSAQAVGVIQTRGGKVTAVGLLARNLTGGAARDRSVLASF